MQFQAWRARARGIAEELTARASFRSTRSVAIMGALDETRRQIGLRLPGGVVPREQSPGEAVPEGAAPPWPVASVSYGGRAAPRGTRRSGRVSSSPAAPGERSPPRDHRRFSKHRSPGWPAVSVACRAARHRGGIAGAAAARVESIPKRLASPTPTPTPTPTVRPVPAAARPPLQPVRTCSIAEAASRLAPRHVLRQRAQRRPPARSSTTTRAAPTPARHGQRHEGADQRGGPWPCWAPTIVRAPPFLSPERNPGQVVLVGGGDITLASGSDHLPRLGQHARPRSAGLNASLGRCAGHLDRARLLGVLGWTPWQPSWNRTEELSRRLVQPR